MVYLLPLGPRGIAQPGSSCEYHRKSFKKGFQPFFLPAAE